VFASLEDKLFEHEGEEDTHNDHRRKTLQHADDVGDDAPQVGIVGFLMLLVPWDSYFHK
jgi:hypothetical protein